MIFCQLQTVSATVRCLEFWGVWERYINARALGGAVAAAAVAPPSPPTAPPAPPPPAPPPLDVPLCPLAAPPAPGGAYTHHTNKKQERREGM